MAVENVENKEWLSDRQCGLCRGMLSQPVNVPCCSSLSCKRCALKHLETTSKCWSCESSVNEDQLAEHKDIGESIEQIITSLLACALCRESCHRAVFLPCCQGDAVCRGCGVKHITSLRNCWSCNKANIRSEDLEADQQLRDALNYNKDEKEHSQELLNKLFLRKIDLIEEKTRRTQAETDKSDKIVVNNTNGVNQDGESAKEQDGEEEVRERGEASPTPDKKSSKRERSGSREKRRDRKRKHKEDHRRDEKRKRKHRDRSRDRHRSRDRDRERDRSKSRTRERNKPKVKEEENAEEKKEIKKDMKKENGVGSFAALQKRIRIENEIVEKRVKEKVEEYISSMVSQQLRVGKNEIEREVLKKVDLARQNMEEEVKLEIDLMKKKRETEEKMKMDEMNARMAEKEQSLENERKKLAEDRLAILENQMRIEKEKQKEKKKLEKKSKLEQMKILGKDKSRPRLSFSLNKN